MSKTRYSNFKIFAIQPLDGCSGSILKVLKENEIYYLLNDYQISPDGRLTYNKSYPDNLYYALRMQLNICAIAGKNGSGKSTLIEMILMAVNNIAYHLKLKNDLEEVKQLKVALYFQAGSRYKITFNGAKLIVEQFNEAGVLQSTDNSNFSLGELKGLFYTICMNYSHYAYNYRDYMSNEQPDWLSPLFHKNDAYQTPLVINPWRDNGDIIITRENALVQSRLIANLLRPDFWYNYNFRNVTENLRAYALRLKLDESKVYKGELYRRVDTSTSKKSASTASVTYSDLGELRKDEIWFQINREYDFNLEKYREQSDEFARVAMDYLIRKLVSISVKYEEYGGYFDTEINNFDYKKLRDYIYRVTRDRSHIGFKLRQTLNFLRYRHIDTASQTILLDDLSIKIQETINAKPNYRDHIIELIPPPIFKIDIILQPISGNKIDIYLASLSSGEKQMIYSLSSILYHLNNLDSVSAKSKTKVKYRTAQIILEEIELYFHPEMQRKYVRFLRQNIMWLGLEDIHDINICFVTHSPFILSDIPDANILFLQLKDGKATQVNRFRKTFAANIHDLLADAFFMQDGVCGAFAIEEINKTIVYLNACARKNELTEMLKVAPDDEQLLDELVDVENDVNNENPNDHALLINNIGEPVIKTKLEEMYNEASRILTAEIKY